MPRELGRRWVVFCYYESGYRLSFDPVLRAEICLRLPSSKGQCQWRVPSSHCPSQNPNLNSESLRCPQQGNRPGLHPPFRLDFHGNPGRHSQRLWRFSSRSLLSLTATFTLPGELLNFLFSLTKQLANNVWNISLGGKKWTTKPQLFDRFLNNTPADVLRTHQREIC